jgi:hypothetical protein
MDPAVDLYSMLDSRRRAGCPSFLQRTLQYSATYGQRGSRGGTSPVADRLRLAIGFDRGPVHSALSLLAIWCSSAAGSAALRVHAAHVVQLDSGCSVEPQPPGDPAASCPLPAGLDIPLPPPSAQRPALQLVLLIWDAFPEPPCAKRASIPSGPQPAGRATSSPKAPVQSGRLCGIIPAGDKVWVMQLPLDGLAARSSGELQLRTWQEAPEQQQQQQQQQQEQQQQEQQHIRFSEPMADGHAYSSTLQGTRLHLQLEQPQPAENGAAAALDGKRQPSARQRLGQLLARRPMYLGVTASDLQLDGSRTARFRLLPSWGLKREQQQQQRQHQGAVPDTLPCGTCPLCSQRCHLLHGLKLHLQASHAHHRCPPPNMPPTTAL